MLSVQGAKFGHSLPGSDLLVNHERASGEKRGARSPYAPENDATTGSSHVSPWGAATLLKRRSSWWILTILTLVCGVLAWHVALLVQGRPGLVDPALLWRDVRPVNTDVKIAKSAKVDPLPLSPRYSLPPVEKYAAIIERLDLPRLTVRG